VALVLVANAALRDRTWSHEWLWSLYELHFATIFLAPIVAGLAAWEGARLSRIGSLVGSSGGSVRAVGARWAALVAWVAAVYVAGVLGLVLWVQREGLGGWPSVRDLSTIVPALVFLGGWAGAGMAFGVRAASALAAPLAAVATFAALLIGYSTVTPLVRVGGATASLVGVQPNPAVQLAQVVAYALLAGVGLALAADRLCGRGARSPASAVLGGALLAVVGVTWASGATELTDAPAHVRCEGSAPEVCLAPGYEPSRRALVRDLAPLFESTRSRGLLSPERLTQDPGDPSPLTAVLPLDVVLGSREPAALAALMADAYVPSDCDVLSTEVVFRAWYGLDWWMLAQLAPQPTDDPQLPPELVSGDEAAALRWLAGAMSILEQCGAVEPGR
jgi:hypothetical protein